MDTQTDNLVLGRGRLYFERFADSTYVGRGESYFGNSTAFSVTPNKTTQDITGSVGGRLVRLETVTISETFDGEFTTDNMSMANLSIWFGAKSAGIATGEGIVTTVVKVNRGYHYQVGVTASNPIGRRDFASLTVSKTGSPEPLPEGNVDVSLEDGRVYVRPNAPNLVDGDQVTIVGVALDAGESIVIPSGASVVGALRFVGETIAGKRQNLYVPLADLTTAADFTLKGDQWQELRFKVSARKRMGHDLYYLASCA